jgi:hypothetical protein
VSLRERKVNAFEKTSRRSERKVSSVLAMYQNAPVECSSHGDVVWYLHSQASRSRSAKKIDWWVIKSRRTRALSSRVGKWLKP